MPTHTEAVFEIGLFEEGGDVGPFVGGDDGDGGGRWRDGGREGGTGGGEERGGAGFVKKRGKGGARKDIREAGWIGGVCSGEWKRAGKAHAEVVVWRREGGERERVGGGKDCIHFINARVLGYILHVSCLYNKSGAERCTTICTERQGHKGEVGEVAWCGVVSNVFINKEDEFMLETTCI
jgi:hypothetical protein